jgi:parallel beta-helix repeat protein
MKNILLTIFVLLAGLLLTRSLLPADFSILHKTTAETVKKSPAIKFAQMSQEVAIKAANRGKPFVDMTDGHELLAAYEGEAAMHSVLESNQAKPLGLASADYDEDGMPDLVSAYATATSGLITIHRGNVDAVYPNTPDARRRKAEGAFTNAPFLSPAKMFRVFAAPDFIEAGDFDADRHMDLLTAQRGSNTLHFMRGDGRGNLGAAEAIVLPGIINALSSGDTNRADGLSDIVVSIEQADNPWLLVFEGYNGAVKSSPEAIALPAPAKALAMGYLNDDPQGDIAVGAGRELIIVHGRDRKITLEAGMRANLPQAEISRRQWSANITSLAIGDFTGDQRLELGVAAEDGSVQLVSEKPAKGALQTASINPDDWTVETVATSQGTGQGKLLCARLSALNHETLVLSDQSSRRIQVWMDDEERRTRKDATLRGAAGEREAPVSLEVDGEPVAILPMRLNIDGINDLVILREGASAPMIINSISATITVCNSGDCGSTGCGSLRDLINRANSNSSGSNVIVFDNNAFQGTPTITVGTQLPTITKALTIDGTSTGSCSGSLLSQEVEPQVLNAVQVTSTNNVATGLRVNNGGCVIRNLAINRVGSAIQITNSRGSIIEGNKIGTDPTGNTVRNNTNRGIHLNNAGGNTVGGNPNAGGINIISGNQIGLDISGLSATDNVIRFNNIGTNAGANQVLGNNTNVRITAGASRNRIGSAVTSSFDNAIFGSLSEGVLIDSANGNLVQANFFQLNQGDGIKIQSASGNTIGGATATGSSRNFIWSSSSDGIEINGLASTDNLVQGNNIGLNFDNNGNPLDTHNNQNGILVTASASNNVIGGDSAALGNHIAFNVFNGVTILTGTGNRILSNFIFNNGLLGIDLGNDGADNNDDKDPDGGANAKQNYPLITASTVPIGLVESELVPHAIATISGTFNSTPNSTFTLQFQYCAQPCIGSGRQFSGCIPTTLTLADGSNPVVTTDANGNANYAFQFNLPNNANSGFVNATATNNATNNTSEISPCSQIGAAANCTYALSATTAAVTAAGGNSSFTVTVQNNCPWTAISNAPWLTTPSSGNGNGTVNYSFAQNTTAAIRVGIITVGTQTHTVTQAAATAGPFIANVAKEGKHIRINGSGFVQGARVLRDGEDLKGIEITPTSMLGKKAAKGVATSARIQVRNPDGSLSNEVIYVAPQ